MQVLDAGSTIGQIALSHVLWSGGRRTAKSTDIDLRGYMTIEYRELSEAFRITAFIDILGWGSLTEGIPLLVLRRMKRGEGLSVDEQAQAQRLYERVEIARRINGNIRAILDELRELCRPLHEIDGTRAARQFWMNSHVTFVRSSDNIFAHSSSFQVIAVFVSELLKRGLERGILLRAGISGGFVYHVEDSVVGVADPRSRDISLFGDGITTAVEAEKCMRGSGVHAWCHDCLPGLLNEHLNGALRTGTTGAGELLWWRDLRIVWPQGLLAEHVTPIRTAWIEDRIERLQSGSELNGTERQRRDARPRATRWTYLKRFAPSESSDRMREPQRRDFLRWARLATCIARTIGTVVGFLFRWRPRFPAA